MSCTAYCVNPILQVGVSVFSSVGGVCVSFLNSEQSLFCFSSNSNSILLLKKGVFGFSAVVFLLVVFSICCCYYQQSTSFQKTHFEFSLQFGLMLLGIMPRNSNLTNFVLYSPSLFLGAARALELTCQISSSI